MRFLVVAAVVVMVVALGVVADMPLPFTRPLTVEDPLLHGDDVTILQNLIVRAPGVSKLVASGSYDKATAHAVSQLQSYFNLAVNGAFGKNEADALLDCCSSDGYRDDGLIPPWAKYKFFIPVYRNRSIESAGILYSANGTVLLTFPARTHGQNLPDSNEQANMFTSDGVTPTGLMSCDLNSPEPDPVSYGPYPITRMVDGMGGNAGFLISNIRDGILLHTGEWPDWHPPMNMPNSHGCIHSYPESVHAIYKTLVSIGVEVRNNTFGKLPYPYKPQGVMSIQQID